MFDLQTLGHIDYAVLLWFVGESLCHSVLQQDSVQKLIHSADLHFDVVMVETFVNECFLGFAHKFKATIVQVCAYGGGNFMADWVGSPHPYTYFPNDLTHYTDKMNLWERTHNTIVSLLIHVRRQLIHLPKQNAAMQKHFNYTDSLPPVWELEYKKSLVITNIHHTLSYPKLLMPNYVQVCGMHVKPPTKPPQGRNVELI
jgi:glucuronosyltransferase